MPQAQDLKKQRNQYLFNIVIMAARHAVVTGDLEQSELDQLIAKESEVLEEAGSAHESVSVLFEIILSSYNGSEVDIMEFGGSLELFRKETAGNASCKSLLWLHSLKYNLQAYQKVVSGKISLCDQRITIINTLIDDYGITANTLGWFYDAMITLVQKEQEMCVEHLINKGFDSSMSPIEGAHESSPFVGAVTIDGFSEKHSISQLRDGVKDRKLNILRLLLTAGLKDIDTLLQSAYKAGFQQAFYLLIARGDANLETIEAIMEQGSIESDGIVSCDKIWVIPFKLRQHCTAYCSDIGQKARAFFTKERYFLKLTKSMLNISKKTLPKAFKQYTTLVKIGSFLGQCHPIKFHKAKRAFVLATCGSPFLTGFRLKGGCSNESYGNWEMVIEPDWTREAGVWQAMKDDYDSSHPPKNSPKQIQLQ